MSTAAILTLRIIRGAFGLLTLWQIMGLLSVLVWIANGGDIDREVVAWMVVKLLALALFLALFFAVRGMVNWIHQKRHGPGAGPLLRRWSL